MTASANTVLIVDDNPLGREALGDVLAPEGYTLAFAPDGPTALAAAAELRPDVILLDVMMPGMDGFEVCRRLRADVELCEVPVLMVTALDDRASRLKGIESGADDFVSKPFDRIELRARIRTIMRLNRYRKLRDEHLRLEKAYAELQETHEGTLRGWVEALDLRDKETVGHSDRVVELTVRLARAAGIDGQELTDLRRGALLHDVGKLGVPDGILLKPGELSEEERDVMKQHPRYAYEWLHAIPYLRKTATIPYCHHEKWDGSGYPRGLKGEEIPLGARIFALVDVWDALRSGRPYRGPLSEAEALTYIRKGSGTHFDPQLVELFIKLIGGAQGGDESAP